MNPYAHGTTRSKLAGVAFNRKDACPLCAHCGQVLPPANPFHSQPVKAKIYDFVAKHTQGVTSEQIMSHVYADDPDGGPEWTTVIGVHVNLMNKKLNPLGLRIASPRGRGAHYRLRPFPEPVSDIYGAKTMTPLLARQLRESYKSVRSHRKLAAQYGLSVGAVGRALRKRAGK